MTHTNNIEKKLQRTLETNSAAFACTRARSISSWVTSRFPICIFSRIVESNKIGSCDTIPIWDLFLVLT